MRLRIFALAGAAAIMGFNPAAAAPDPQVEVPNVPLPVELTTPPPASPPPRWQLLGFTSASFTGDTGVLGFTLGCQAEIADTCRGTSCLAR
jgi:hypothetical protein